MRDDKVVVGRDEAGNYIYMDIQIADGELTFPKSEHYHNTPNCREFPLGTTWKCNECENIWIVRTGDKGNFWEIYGS